MTAGGFTPLSVVPDVEQVRLFDAARPREAQLVAVGLLRAGTAQGRAVAVLRVDLPDGEQLFVQTTWRLFKGAARALAASPIAAEEVDD